jgi:2-methylcitrate dehydratase PrpD
MGATAEFSRLLQSITRDTITEAAREAGRRLILDGIAVALAGSLEPAPRIIAGHLGGLGGAEQATALNFGFRTSIVSATYMNGASMHVLDYEPMWNPPTHALSTTLPTVLALGEHFEASGEEILTALIKGIEAHGRLRVASRQYEPRGLVFHPPGVAGPVGSAVAASHLLGLDTSAMRRAIGIAASRAGAVMANIGTMTKCTHCGAAAAEGLDAALLAARGFDANPDVIEAPNGFAAAFFTGDWDPGALVAAAPLRILEPGYAIKLFPSQYATHFVIEAALAARMRIDSIDRIRSLEIIGPVMPYVDRPQPATGLDAKFSFQYAAAAALLDGKAGIETFTDERCRRVDVTSMLPRVRFRQSPDIPATLDHMRVEINIILDGGETVTAECARPRGAWGAPISAGAHAAKVRDCMRRVMDDNAVERLIDRLQHFDSLSGTAVRALARTLGGFR